MWGEVFTYVSPPQAQRHYFEAVLRHRLAALGQFNQDHKRVTLALQQKEDYIQDTHTHKGLGHSMLNTAHHIIPSPSPCRLFTFDIT